MSQLAVGFAEVDVSPNIGVHIPGFFGDRVAEEIADPIMARAVVFKNGDAALAICVVDVICLLEYDTRRAKQRASELTGIPPENMLIAATHTHYGPATVSIFNTDRDDAYCDYMVRGIADAIALAAKRAQPVLIAHTSGRLPEEVHNRRWWMKDGTVVMNPGYQSPDRVRPAGPVDSEAVLLAVMQPDRLTPAGALANFALHYVGGPYSNSISADYFGYFCRALPRLWGRPLHAILANGTCGDVNACNFDEPPPEYPHPFYEAERIADCLAAELYKRWRQIRPSAYTGEVKLAAANAYPIFRRRAPTEEEINWAKEMTSGPPQPDNREWVYACEILKLLDEPAEVPAQIQAMRIGDLGIVGLPGEVFVEIGLEIKRRSPFPRTMVIELANDWLGYIPTRRAFEEGGYETRLARSSKALPETGEQWADVAVRLLNELWQA